ncbi:MAG TPA: glucosamine-6-phosphate deaminase [Verrucomicrobiae bacterium]|nr:glucosamine-6-phosphate deaminase [Verrucomicrobiae bacterium]
MNLFKFDSETAWVNGIASLWRDRLRTNPKLRMCLPSGHTPNPIFAAMGKSVAAGQVSFKQAEIFALDEFGGLPPDDEGLCANMLQRYLLKHIDLPPQNFHRIDPNGKNVAQEYDGFIGAGFDLTLLGIGLNGHLGMNEPGSPIDGTTRRVELHPTTVASSAKYLTHKNLPTWGVAVGLKHLLGSKEVWLLANGTKKVEIIQRATKGPVSNDVPASLLRNHPNAFFMVDAEAGALV